jgi:LAO/AO transport system kinase
MQYFGENRISADQFVEGILSGDKVHLSKALSLVESSRDSDLSLKLSVLEGIFHKSGNAIRIGITGAPGVGKSTFIEALGSLLLSRGLKLAVLTIDPTSQRSHGSILGDKTRMAQLSKSENAFIRPSAAGRNLGGVAHHTRESILICEAAGFEVVIVETVGVGQSEIEVRKMVDFFLLLLIPGAGDELQGIKKGIVEIADCLAINKADGENLSKARQAQATYQNALHFLTPVNSKWEPKVFTCSALENQGLEQIWSNVESYLEQMKANGNLEQQRAQQRISWMEDCIRQAISRQLRLSEEQAGGFEQLKNEVEAGKILPNTAAELVMQKLAG